MQRWQPDTHPEYEIEYDPDTLVASEVLYDPKWSKGNVAHDGDYKGKPVKNPQAEFERLLASNQWKNQVVGAVHDALPDAMKKPVLDSDGDPVLDKDGRPLLRVKEKHQAAWSGDIDKRKITVTVPGLPALAAPKIQTALSKHGAGVILRPVV